MTHSRSALRLSSAVVAALLATSALQGCAPLVVGGAMVGTALVATDRRTAGAQLEDQSIELKAGNRAREVSPAGHVNVTSYNRQVLLTGEVPSDSDRRAVEQAVAGIENLRSITNELAVMGASSLTSRSNDVVLGGKVKAAFVDTKDLQAQAIKVVAERGVVHLMGIVTEREAARAAEVARAVGGVLKVVRVFEIITEEQLARLQPAPAPR